jgi:predicted GTPase
MGAREGNDVNRSHSFDDIWKEVFSKFSPDFLERMRREEIEKLKRVNILISGKSGVGKTTLINKIFGHTVGKVGRGRPVTDKITWYEPPGVPLRLCDTKGLELKDSSKSWMI